MCKDLTTKNKIENLMLYLNDYKKYTGPSFVNFECYYQIEILLQCHENKLAIF